MTVSDALAYQQTKIIWNPNGQSSNHYQFVLKLLNCNQKQRRVDILLNEVKNYSEVMAANSGYMGRTSQWKLYKVSKSSSSSLVVHFNVVVYHVSLYGRTINKTPSAWSKHSELLLSHHSLWIFEQKQNCYNTALSYSSDFQLFISKSYREPWETFF